MAYTTINFKTKNKLKQAVMEQNQFERGKVTCFQPGLGPDLSNYTGKVCLEGPHYPEPHKWYAEAELVNGIVVRVK
jgi:hypothetical protein